MRDLVDQRGLRPPLSLLSRAGGLRPRPVEKATPPVGGTVASAADEIRLEFSEGVEPRFSSVTVTNAGGARRPAQGDGRPGRHQDADRQDRQAAGAGRLYRELARGLGRHPPYPGRFQLHGQTVTSQDRTIEMRINMTRTSPSRLLVSLAAPALAQESRRATSRSQGLGARHAEGRDVGAGYLDIHNNGATADRLTGGSADFARRRGARDEDARRHDEDAQARRTASRFPPTARSKLAPSGYHSCSRSDAADGQGRDRR